ncbi:cell envelope integrity protein CreD [Methylomonas montana]|uniref:cell envelope integrity protein CreD n=1 Tax=Methylomonas montana TaxID=3058963 RepID=UPI002658E302|nr:cell envelope integrity protein CreD [Methylomonas montana]WKJ89250.1 cell envelope integrity protein CreD [Methylomonas montana]
MQSKLWHKILIMLALTVALLIPINMINNLAGERENRQLQVVNDIAASSAGPQKLFGPLLVVPYSEQWTEIAETRRDNAPIRESVQRVENRYLYFLPEHLNMAGELATETKQRGLFEVRSYVLNVSVKGDIKLPGGYGKPQPLHGGQIEFGAPYVGVALSDMRGVLQAPGLEWAGKTYAFEQGSALPLEDVNGMHATLEEMPVEFGAISLPFAFNLKLRGIESLDFVPAGKQTSVEISSAWQHPSFYGRFLPDPQSQQIGAEGFHALWTVDALASNVAQSLNKCRTIAAFDSFGIRLMEPINIYSLSDRATKYGFLFVCLTFAAIFLFEILKNLAIHPAQYALVGLALAMFFLLLLSLSEHLDFLVAYLLATAACVSLIGVYLSAVLHSSKRGFSACGLLAGLFASLYVLLESEDNALMLGSLLMFVLLGVAMLSTRKLDWYGLNQPAAADANDQAATTTS